MASVSDLKLFFSTKVISLYWMLIEQNNPQKSNTRLNKNSIHHLPHKSLLQHKIPTNVYRSLWLRLVMSDDLLQLVLFTCYFMLWFYWPSNFRIYISRSVDNCLCSLCSALEVLQVHMVLYKLLFKIIIIAIMSDMSA